MPLTSKKVVRDNEIYCDITHCKIRCCDINTPCRNCRFYKAYVSFLICTHNETLLNDLEYSIRVGVNEK